MRQRTKNPWLQIINSSMCRDMLNDLIAVKIIEQYLWHILMSMHGNFPGKVVSRSA